MKYKQLCPKSIRSNESKQNKRCSLCDSLLKTQRYLSIGKSIQDSIIINNRKTITYAECCKKYLNDKCITDKLNIICLKCCDNLKHIHSLHLSAQELTKKLRRICYKTKRLNRIRLQTDIKEEPSSNIIQPIQTTNIPSVNSAFIPPQIYPNEYDCCRDYLCHHRMNNPSEIPYAQFLIDSPVSTDLSHHQQQRNDTNNEQLIIDDDRSISPCTINGDESGSKGTRLTRRQYDFLITLPDQQSLNAFIEASATESGSRWTWRRTSANSRGYKIYYVCNYSMRRHYHPCPAAMYALFNPEGTISIFSHGKHEHIPKNRLPLSITDETKDEIFKCLHAGMSTGDIRDHLVQHKLPFGDAKKLNNFIKYHKELLRFGAVTNVRVNGSAYRQPQYWAVRRPPSSSVINANTTTTPTTM